MWLEEIWRRGFLLCAAHQGNTTLPADFWRQDEDVRNAEKDLHSLLFKHLLPWKQSVSLLTAAGCGGPARAGCAPRFRLLLRV